MVLYKWSIHRTKENAKEVNEIVNRFISGCYNWDETCYLSVNSKDRHNYTKNNTNYLANYPLITLEELRNVNADGSITRNEINDYNLIYY